MIGAAYVKPRDEPVATMIAHQVPNEADGEALSAK